MTHKTGHQMLESIKHKKTHTLGLENKADNADLEKAQGFALVETDVTSFLL